MPRRISYLLEMQAARETGRQVLGVLNDRRDDEPLVAVVLSRAVEVLGHHGVLAVRHSILLQIASAHAGSHHTQRSSARTAAAAAAGHLPIRDGSALPRFFD